MTEQAQAWRRQTGARLEIDEVADHDPPAMLAARLQEQTLAVDLHPRHRTLYDTYLQRERKKVLG